MTQHATKIRREWARPSAETFSIAPIADILKLRVWGDIGEKKEVIDPFARNSTWANWTNDLNPQTSAKYHMKAEDFVEFLLKERGDGWADVALMDPPYSARQLKECYNSIGYDATTADTQTIRILMCVRRGLARLLKPGGLAISFGWNTVGFGRGLGFELDEIVLVCHGGNHNDTIVTIEHKS